MTATPENAPCWHVPQHPREIYIYSFPKKARGHTMCWRWVVGGSRPATGGWWRLVAFGGGGRLAVGGGWWLAVDGPLRRSLRAVLNKKNSSPLRVPLLESQLGWTRAVEDAGTGPDSDRTVALLRTDAVTWTACQEGHSQVYSGGGKTEDSPLGLRGTPEGRSRGSTYFTSDLRTSIGCETATQHDLSCSWIPATTSRFCHRDTP